MDFEMTPGWLPFHPDPSTPCFRLPAGSVDAHCHVFGPGNVFPYAPTRKYTPCDASRQQLFALRDRLGFERNVIVQATCHGTDNSALIDALRHSEGRARGVASVSRSVSDRELLDMHEAGVRATRFNFVRRLVDFTPKEELTEIAARIAPLGWHVVVYFEAVDLPSCGTSSRACPPSWSWITWAGRMSAGPSTVRSSNCSCVSCENTRTCGPRSAVRSDSAYPVLQRSPVNNTRTGTLCHSRSDWCPSFRIACFGAPTGRIRI
jgi:hypothetical protein